MLFGSQTGNAQRLAGQLAEPLQQRGYGVKLSCMSEYRTSELRKAKSLLVL